MRAYRQGKNVTGLTSVTKALSLLEIMARQPRAWGVSELARELDQNKSNVHRYLQTLISLGYVSSDPESGRYFPTLKLWEIGLQVTNGLPIKRLAQPQLTALSGTVKRTVHLSVLEGLEAVYIDRIEAPTPMEPTVDIGSRAPAQCVATGLAMMSLLDDDELSQWDRPLEQPTERSPRDFAEVMTRIEETRTRGFALTRGSWRRGVLGIAAPLRCTGGPSQVTHAAIGLSCLDIDVSDDTIAELAKYVVYSVERLNDAIRAA